MIDLRIIAGAAGLILAAYGGWQVRSWRCESQIAEIQREAMEAEDALRAQMEAAAIDYEAFRAGNETAGTRTQTKIREVYRNVEVPADCAALPDAVVLLNRARETANNAVASESGSAVQGD